MKKWNVFIMALCLFLFGCQKNSMKLEGEETTTITSMKENSEEESSEKDVVEQQSNTFSKEEIESYIEVQEKMQDLAKKYDNGEGYVDDKQKGQLLQEMRLLVNGEKTKGNVSNYSYGKDYVYVEYTSGIGCIYTIPTKGVWSGGSIGTAVGYEPNRDGWDTAMHYGLFDAVGADINQLSIENECSWIKDFYGTESYGVASYKDGQVNLDSLQAMSNANVIVWEGHGQYVESLGIPVLITGMEYGLYENDTHIDTLITEKVLLLTINIFNQVTSKSKIAITPEYVRQYVDVKEGAIVYLGSCYSAKNEELANAFIEKGAGVVLGYSNTVEQAYEIEMHYYIMYDLSMGSTVKSAVSFAKSKAGQKDKNGTTIKIIEDENISLISHEQVVLDSCFEQGEGTKENPYLVTSERNLWRMAYMSEKGYEFKDIYIAMENDINFSRLFLEFNGIPTFKGHFDGRNHTISYVNIVKEYTEEDSGEGVGLFGVVKGGEISNLYLKDSSVKGTFVNGVGGIVGYAWEDAIIENCHNEATVEGGSAGGIVGVGQGITIRNCSNRGTISMGDDKKIGKNTLVNCNIGGIIGTVMNGSVVENCQNYGQVNNDSQLKPYGQVSGISAGGIAGKGWNHFQIINCQNYGSVTSSSYAGGIVGDVSHTGSQQVAENDCVIIDSCTNNGTINGTPSREIGFFEYFPGKVNINNCNNKEPDTQEESSSEQSTETEEESSTEEQTTEAPSVTISGFTDWEISLKEIEDGWISLPTISVKFAETVEESEKIGILNNAKLTSSENNVVEVQKTTNTTFANSHFITAKLQIKKVGTAKVTLTIDGKQHSIVITVTE